MLKHILFFNKRLPKMPKMAFYFQSHFFKSNKVIMPQVNNVKKIHSKDELQIENFYNYDEDTRSLTKKEPEFKQRQHRQRSPRKTFSNQAFNETKKLFRQGLNEDAFDTWLKENDGHYQINQVEYIFSSLIELENIKLATKVINSIKSGVVYSNASKYDLKNGLPWDKLKEIYFMLLLCKNFGK